MTSSLVGSEMCIRDRLEAVKAFLANSLGEKAVSEDTTLKTFNTFHIKDCLLYTSDAADDISV
eukprot:3490368-Prorocentrum_lima.AAC.1